MKNMLFYSFILVITTSCGMFEHRDFYNEMTFDEWNAPFFLPGRDFNTVPGDNERTYYYDDPKIMAKRTPASEETRQGNLYSSSLKRELFTLENSLSDAEYNHYIGVENDLATISEKIYYLRLSHRGRRAYLEAKGIASAKGNSYSNSRTAQNPARTYSPAGVSLGMTKEQVEAFLGRPSKLEVAGDPKYQNERWTYATGETVRYIYFENGSVGGWAED